MRIAGIGLMAISLVAACVLPLRAASPLATTFAQAHDAYRAKEYPKALDLYRQVAAAVNNPVVHYDLGCAAFKAGRIGEALLHFEKARLLAPRDPDVQANLEFARNRIKDAAPEEEADLLSRIVWGPLERVSMNELATALSIVWWLAMASLLAMVLARDEDRRAFWRMPLGVLVGLSILLAVIFAIKYHGEVMTEHAIVLARETAVLSGPATDEVKRFVLHEGTRVRLLGRWDKWVHVALPNGENGWALSAQIGAI